jgi:amino acid adenylation domain-containing protein
VIYTSGTTGVPNGVQVRHRGLVNYALWAARAYRLDAGTGSLVHSSIAFDLTLTSLLAPLVVGGRVELLPEAPGLAALVAAIRSRQDITCVKLTPTHLRLLMGVLESHELAGRLHTLVVGGEELAADAIEPLRRRAPGTVIVNEYGPTETVVGSTAHFVDPSDPHHGAVSIGTPIANTSVYVLDPRGGLLPEGAPGEIYIGGAGVAAGYLGRDTLTQARFVADSPDPGSGSGSGSGRLYRTGDRARRLAGGELQYLGRLDDQLKVRGVRVEPAEVEATVAAHESVAAAAVAPRRLHGTDDAAPVIDEPQLVAFVVPASGRTVDQAAIIAHCRERLLEAMVPAAVVAIVALPTTANGKLDRGALPTVVRRSAQGFGRGEPTTETEEILAGAIATVLDLERVGIDDDYFALGGDSIRSVMVASRAHGRGVPVTVADLHAHPTVRACAAAVDARAETEAGSPQLVPFALVSAEDRALMPADVEDAFPLNLLQEGMIFHRDFAAKSAVYHAIASIRLRAPFELEVLRTVVRQLVERHPMLRTSFDQHTFNIPLQLVHGTFQTPLHYEDLRELPESERDRRVAEWVAGEKERGFELDEFPLIRLMAQRLTDDSFQLTYGFHHEIIDGWSEALMMTELFSHYFAVIFDEPISIKPPRSSMRDAVALELDALKRPENYEFWDRYLEDATLMRLPRLNEGPRADTGARDIMRIAVPVPPELSDALKRVALGLAVPFKTVLLAAHMSVMSTYGGGIDTLTYTVTNGRPEDVDGTTAIGLFVNSLALRVRLIGGTWSDLILRTLTSERASLPYRRLPMAELKRHQGNEPLAETLFFFTDYHVFRALDRWRDRGVEDVTSELYGESTFPFCAIFRLNRDTSQLEVRIEYDRLQFEAELMDRLRDSYVAALEAIATDPDARYEQSCLTPAEDVRLTTAEWNRTDQQVASRSSLHELFEARADERPDAIALEGPAGAITYGGLERAANRLAHALRRRGVGPETRVGVLAERSPELVVALLAVLKAGGAYVPLDPGQPPARTMAILRDSGAKHVLAQERLEVDGATAGVEVLAIEPELIESPAAGRPASTVSPANAAYVIYTSGTTGSPKGVVVEHRNAANSTDARRPFYGGAPERFLLVSSYAFDSSVAGIFWTLAEGGVLVLPAEDAHLDPDAVAELVRERRISHTLAVPSLLSPLLQAGSASRLSTLRTIITAGEACPSELFDAYRADLPQADFANEYGPTEATVWCTAWRGHERPAGRQLPIGRPIANARTFVLSPHRQPVPITVAGELAIGGAGVSRGYLGAPSLTAERFVPDPFAQEPGARMYLTGDLGRFLPSGELEFIGRADHQVKVRGFRVELGEVEAVLEGHPSVRRAVAVTREVGDGQAELIAYVVGHGDVAPTPAELQRHVRSKLPKYMVPSACVVLDALPLTPSGKVDRTSLPLPDREARTGRRAVPPSTDTEQALAAIWAHVLRVDGIGAHDDFFDLGGESLRAMQVTTRTNNLFGTRLSVRTLFDAPTVEQFAHRVEEAVRELDVAGRPIETGVI